MGNSKLETRNSKLLVPTFPDGSMEATVEHVYVVAGEHIRRGQALVLLRTERFAYDISATVGGTLLELRAVPGDRLAGGQLLAVLAEASTSLPDRPATTSLPDRPASISLPDGPDDATGALPTSHPPRAPASSLRRDQAAVRATPLARRVASAHALELALVAGETRSLLRRDDVLRVLQAAAPVSAPAARPAAQADRGLSAPCAMTAMEVDWSAVDAYLVRSVRTGPGTLGRRACLISATAGALLRHRLVHAAWSEQGILLRRSIDIRLGDAVVAGAADLSAAGVARILAVPRPAGAANAFTIVETASAQWSEAALPAGAAAVLCVGHVLAQPRVVGNNSIAVGQVSLVALIYDVRILDQRQADAFLDDVRSRVERMGSLC